MAAGTVDDRLWHEKYMRRKVDKNWKKNFKRRDKYLRYWQS